MLAEFLDEFKLHSFRMNEDAVGKAILDSKRKPIEMSIFRIAPACIHIVQCEDDLFPQELVIKHQQSSIEELELVVPQDVKDFRLGCGSVANQSRIVDQNSGDLSYETCVGLLIASQIKKGHSGCSSEIRAIQVIVTNQVQNHPFRDERRRQTECIGLVGAAGKQGYRRLAS
jgi:hypothetical protein